MNKDPKSAIVTGAAAGLGRALAVRLGADGWRIALADVNTAGCEETRRLVEAAGGTARVERLDVARLEDWQEVGNRLRADWSQLDLLVNNAAVGGYGDVGTFPLDDWRWLVDTNLYGPIYGCHTLVEWLKRNPQGSHIVNTASFAAIAPSPSMAAYNVAKAGIVALSETLYGELRPHGVGVTVVCPMFFQTGLHDSSRSYDELRSEMSAEGLEKSTMTAEDVAAATLRAMRRKRLYVMPGRQTRWLWWLRRISPVGFMNAIGRDVARRRKAKAAADSTRLPR